MILARGNDLYRNIHCEANVYSDRYVTKYNRKYRPIVFEGDQFSTCKYRENYYSI